MLRKFDDSEPNFSYVFSTFKSRIIIIISFFIYITISKVLLFKYFEVNLLNLKRKYFYSKSNNIADKSCIPEQVEC
jgi:hypothetical protein